MGKNLGGERPAFEELGIKQISEKVQRLPPPTQQGERVRVRRMRCAWGLKHDAKAIAYASRCRWGASARGSTSTR